MTIPPKTLDRWAEEVVRFAMKREWELPVPLSDPDVLEVLRAAVTMVEGFIAHGSAAPQVVVVRPIVQE